MIQLISENIPVAIYQQLRISTGLSPKSNEAAKIGLANSLYSVAVKNEKGDYIGMGRLIGDGGCFCQVVDICVLPEYQGKGIGRKIMEKIRLYIDNQLPSSCYISLIADGDADKLYEQFGFKDTMPTSKGMAFKKK